MSKKQQIITIDGPAGVGKSTVSRKVAAATGFTYLDTGAMYRGLGLYLEQPKVDLDDFNTIEQKLKTLELELVPVVDENDDVGVIINGEDVSDLVRTPQMAMVASRVSGIFVVREFLTKIQRSYGEKGGVVAEGRDIGTVVFPNAAYKFFLDARPEERARRRVAQMRVKGIDANFSQVLAMTIERDKNDSNRDIAPLRQAEDAIRIDTTKIGIIEVIKKILAVVQGAH